jgi:hypothetical protein
LPEIPDEVRVANARVYAKAFYLITGRSPTLKVGSIEPRIADSLKRRGYLAVNK